MSSPALPQAPANGRAAAAQGTARDALDFLDDKHPIFVSHEAAWRRDERRLYGGDAVLEELTQWKGEGSDQYTARKTDAQYLNFGEQHAGILAGHLARVRPLVGRDFSLGTMGQIRERQAITGNPSPGELFYYNVDGIGVDGSEFPAWSDGVQVRACATGHRWTLVEMPSLADVRGAAVAEGDRPTLADVQRGFRPYAIEFSPLQVPNWETSQGRLDFIVFRVPVGRSQVVNGRWQRADATPGYYLLVRAGYAGLGERFLTTTGGWWVFDKDRGEVNRGSLALTGGLIPAFPLIADDSRGTVERPAMSRSLTMELGQLSVGLMRRISERDYNASQAAKAINYILGVNPTPDPKTGKPEAFNLTVDMHESGALIVPVLAWQAPDGSVVQPQIWNSAAAAVPHEVYEGLIASKIAEAKEIMLRQLTSPDASGTSREVQFAKDESPLLARMAANRQRWEQTLIWFAERRAGAAVPTGFSVWPRRFDLAPVVDDIDAMFDTMAKAQVQSPTLSAELVLASAKERGLLKDKKVEDAVRQELTDPIATAVEQ